MSEDGTTTSEGAEAQQGGQQQQDDAAQASRTFTQEDLDRKVGERLARERQKYSDYEDLKAAAARLKEVEDAGKTDIERLSGKLEETTGTLRDLTTDRDRLAAENMRLRVAAEKGLVGDKAKLAERLRGDDLEQLMADADELVRLFNGGQVGTSFDSGVRGQSHAPQSFDDVIRAAAGRRPQRS
jgi:hypothetical protein